MTNTVLPVVTTYVAEIIKRAIETNGTKTALAVHENPIDRQSVVKNDRRVSSQTLRSDTRSILGGQIGEGDNPSQDSKNWKTAHSSSPVIDLCIVPTALIMRFIKGMNLG